MAKPELALKAEAPNEAPNGKARELPPIQMNALSLLEQSNVCWRVVLPATVTADDLEDPSLWAVVSAKVRPFDLIQAIANDSSFWSELLVLSAERGFPTTARVLRTVAFAAMPKNSYSDLPAGYSIEYSPVTNQYTPIRTADGAPMSAPQQSRELARTALVTHAIFRR